jgi:uncharacterized phage protein (TIGR01671 family)
MREIKFRAWDRTKSVMLHDVSTGTIQIFDEGQSAYTENCDLMQFTGLKDKNGKEIYEGDIVRHDVEASGRDGEPKYVRQVGEVTITPLGTIIGGWDLAYCSEREVVGNIHENPELLTN